ncbi:MAG: hypothetical protein KDE56_28340, partial [Anaerolineales bacterium]|nr:hypothetical protein [Anaerolineales bacterium]
MTYKELQTYAVTWVSTLAHDVRQRIILYSMVLLLLLTLFLAYLNYNNLKAGANTDFGPSWSQQEDGA